MLLSGAHNRSSYGHGFVLAPGCFAAAAEFLRRANLDIAGRNPTAERAAAFPDSTDPDKRRKLIDE